MTKGNFVGKNPDDDAFVPSYHDTSSSFWYRKLSFGSNIIVTKTIQDINIDAIGGGSGSAYIGTPTDGTFGTAYNPASLDSNDTHADALDKLSGLLEKLMPDFPPLLNTITLTIDGEYSAYIAGTSTLVTGVQNEPTGIPSTNITSLFFRDTRSNLTSWTGTTLAQTGTIDLSGTVTSGDTNGTLEIVSEQDYYDGTPSQEGFWRAITARINVSPAITPSNSQTFSLQLRHPEMGNTNVLQIYQDDAYASVPSAGSATITGISGSTANVSGVPVYVAGTNVTTTVQCINCVNKFYHASFIGQVSGAGVVTTSVLPTGIQRNEGSNPTVTIVAPIIDDTYVANLSLDVTVQNSAGTQDVDTITNSNIVIIDTVSQQPSSSDFSPESERIESGTGEFPTLTLTTFNSSTSLATNFELQLINGQYQYPPLVDYSTGYDPVGPDYSGLTADPFGSYRWATFNLGSIVDDRFATFEIVNANNFGSDTVLTGVSVQATVIGGSVGLLDVNVPYSGVGDPTNDGDPALDFINSTSTVKRVTFGTVEQTGTLVVRIGIPSGSNKKFAGVKIL